MSKPVIVPARLDITAELGKIREMYKERDEDKGIGILLYGDFGTGKTNIIPTCPGPVLTHSFDPGGLVTIKKELADEESGIFGDIRFEKEDPMNPTVWDLWKKEYERMKRGDILNQLGTFVLDSGTTWASAAMNVILKKAGRTGGPPHQNDYLPAMSMMENKIKDILNHRCHFLFICHEDSTKDDTTGRMFIGPLLMGKLRMRIPLLFSEMYCAQAKQTAAGTEYSLLTRATGLYRARTRMGKGVFDQYEKQDISRLLKISKGGQKKG